MDGREAGDADEVGGGAVELMLVPAGGCFDGLVVLRHAARIDGKVTGTVLAERSVWLGRDAEVRGQIEARDIVVGGRIDGQARAERRMELLSTAVVYGDVEAARVKMEDGCQLYGECRTREVAPTRSASG